MNNYDEYESQNAELQTPDLSSFDSDFETAEAPTQNEVPDGKYQVRIESVRLENSQKGDPMIKFDLQVISGSQSGRHIFRNSVITQATIPYVKRDLKTLGIELSKFSDLENRLEDMLDMTLEVSKRTKGEYANIYFNRRLQLAASIGSERSEADMPF
jgi:hypothetical protein